MCVFEGMVVADKIHINSSHVQAQASSENPVLLLTSMLPLLPFDCQPSPATQSSSAPVMPVKVEFLMFRVGAVANANPLRSMLFHRSTFVSSLKTNQRSRQ